MEKPRANKRRERKDKSNHAIKIVVRHLPPTMTEIEFLEQVDLPENDSYYYCPADWSLGQEATCRAYIDMSLKDIDDVIQFRDRFDGYVFVDSNGAEYIAIVEYAPFQCFMKNKARNHDNKVNTIEKEAHYREYLQKLADEREEASRLGDLKVDFTFEHRTDEKVKSTPLLQYLANKKEKRREEARKRNEEKRKQREEQKLLRTIEVTENTKSKDSASENKKCINTKKSFNKEAQGPDESSKNSRSKRRTERDQRRREEHEQRKLAREREQREKKSERHDRSDKDVVQKQSKYSNQKLIKEVIILKKEKSPEANVVDSKSESEKLADTCGEMLVGNSDNGEPTKNLSKCNVTGKSATSLASHTPQSACLEICTLQEPSRKGKPRASEDRRIRNKDRPSIAIYQPKVKMRLESEEKSPSSCKDSTHATEIPISAPEVDILLPDDKPKSKRFGRRNKQKLQKTNDADHTRCVSKSSESSTSAHSSTLK